MAPKPFPTEKRASVSDAKSAYFEGDFERCLEICAEIRVGSITTASEVALLRARAFLRTGRPREAQSAIVDSLDTHVSLDASLTAQMLVASSRIRQDDVDTGIAILVDAASRADEAHFAVRSEIALCAALGHWAKRDIDTAQTYLAQVDPRSDIIHARALELQAWCHAARRDFPASAASFQATLLRLDSCNARDAAISAMAISMLAIYAAELFDPKLASFVELRLQSMEWSPGLTFQHFVTRLQQAQFHEYAGDTLAAYQFAAMAREIAPSVPFEAMAWAVSSTIARNAGENFSSILLAQRAAELVDTLDTQALVGEERFSLLSTALCCVPYDPANASKLFARYWRLAPVDAMLSLSGDPRLTAEEAYVAGELAQAEGDTDRALACYRNAFETFHKIGYMRRAIIAGFAYLQLSGDAEIRCLVDAALSGIANYITRSLPGTDARLASLERHPIVASLPPAQREVVTLLCLGKTNRQIAAIRNVGEQTVKNMLTKHIFRAFGVSSRSALVSTCLRGCASSD